MAERGAPPPPPDAALLDRVNDWFAWLHRHPEPSFGERETAAFVARTLRSLGYEPSQSVGVGPAGDPLHGVVAVLGAGRSGPALAFRADLDALPLTEVSGLPYSSERAGKGSRSSCALRAAAAPSSIAAWASWPQACIIPARSLL